jgi:hypothetical protein
MLCEALKDKNNINILRDGDKLGEFLAARGLSLSGPTPIMRIETTSTFDDPNVQAKFGMRYSYLERDPDHLVNILSSLGGAEDKTSFIPNPRDVPLHRMDMANLPEPMDAGAVLDLIYRRQEFGVHRPHSCRERTERDAAAQRDDPQGPGWVTARYGDLLFFQKSTPDFLVPSLLGRSSWSQRPPFEDIVKRLATGLYWECLALPNKGLQP